MKKTLAALAIVAVSFLTALPLSAQNVATLALTNGQRPSGDLVDLNARGFVLRIGGEEHAFAVADVVAVEFVVGPVSSAVQAKINAGQPFVALRSGELVDGRLYDIGGTSPLRVTVQTRDGTRDVSSNDIAQIYVNPGVRSTAQAGEAAAIPAGAITVPATVVWTDSGITVSAGQRYQFRGTGDIMLSSSASSGVGGSPAATAPNVKYPVPGAPAGALIGRAGTSAPFLIGDNTQPIQMRGRGRLLLGVNDDHVPDNSGSFSVTVTRVN